MAFEKVFDAGQAAPHKFEKVGDKLEGRFMGSFPHEGDYGPTKKHIFDTPKGPVVVFGQKHLMDQLPGVKPGTMVKIVFKEEKPAQKKGRHPMKIFEIYQDKDSWIAVEGVDSEPSEELVETDGYEALNSTDDLGDESSLDAEEPAPDELPPSARQPQRVNAPAPDAARQAKVNALLNKARAGKTA